MLLIVNDGILLWNQQCLAPKLDVNEIKEPINKVIFAFCSQK